MISNRCRTEKRCPLWIHHLFPSGYKPKVEVARSAQRPVFNVANETALLRESKSQSRHERHGVLLLNHFMAIIYRKMGKAWQGSTGICPCPACRVYLGFPIQTFNVELWRRVWRSVWARLCLGNLKNWLSFHQQTGVPSKMQPHPFGCGEKWYLGKWN